MARNLLAVGDIHLENFGTWRDTEGRLIWGVNDFDEAAVMPYTLDLVRLAASALLARTENHPRATAICEAILDGYLKGLRTPRPFVLERENEWLRHLVLLPEEKHAKFWRAIAKLESEMAPPHFHQALLRSLPADAVEQKIARRTAGTGSLGRPRFVLEATWLGGPVVREAKGLLPSGWDYALGRKDAPIKAGKIARSRFRCPDPHYRVRDEIVVRRLSPNSRKLDATEDSPDLLSRDMLRSMGWELANCHAGSSDVETLTQNVEARGSEWLRHSAKTAAEQVRGDFAQYCRSQP